MKRVIWVLIAAAVILLVWFLLKPSGSRMYLYSRILEEKRTLLYHLPHDYQESGLHYPVLYLLDAYAKSSTYGPSFYQAAGQVSKLESEGIPPLIIIGVVNTNRSRDMLPVKTEYHADGGKADRFLGFVTEELIPFIDQNFRTTGERILYGRSDSGLFTAYALLENPEAFTAYIPSSPTVGFCPDLIRSGTRLLFRNNPDLSKSLYIIYGDNDIKWVKDFIPEVVREIRELAPATFRFEVKVVPSGGHIPKSSLISGLRFIYPPNNKARTK